MLTVRLLNKNLRVHSRRVCRGQKCCLHNPSKHHMRSWPLFIRTDKFTLAERVCKHGVGHPDPDSVRHLDPAGCLLLGVHGCDGCCRKPAKRG